VVILGFWGLLAQYGFRKMSILSVTNTKKLFMQPKNRMLSAGKQVNKRTG
jgi:hypothetical protein